MATFQIYRTSDGYTFSDDKPCEGAFKGNELGDFAWFVTLNNVKDFRTLYAEVGKFIFTGMAIEIYDSYRE